MSGLSAISGSYGACAIVPKREDYLIVGALDTREIRIAAENCLTFSKKALSNPVVLGTASIACLATGHWIIGSLLGVGCVVSTCRQYRQLHG